MVLKIYLPIYLLLCMTVAFAIPTYRSYGEAGFHAITFGKIENACNYIGFIMQTLIIPLFVAWLSYTILERTYFYLVSISNLKTQTLPVIILIHITLKWISTRQFQKSNSWRTGI